MRRRVTDFLLPVLALLTLHPAVPAGAALVGGMALTLALGNPWLEQVRWLSSSLLAWVIVGLGAGTDLATVWRYGAGSAGYTLVEIALAMALGLALGRRLGTEPVTSLLVTSGVSVCGASAIAVIALSTRAKAHQISLSLAIIFLLNAIGILCLPPLGHQAGLGQVAFGLWSALSITDTSSVVGATMSYGATAVVVATNAKLARALWIVPLALVVRRMAPPAEGEAIQRGRFPWFIVGFLICAGIITWFPAARPAGQIVLAAAKRLLVLTLFLMGSSLTRESLRAIGARPLLQALGLWLIVTASTFGAIRAGWIR